MILRKLDTDDLLADSVLCVYADLGLSCHTCIKIHITEKKTGMLRIVQRAKEPNPTASLLERDAVWRKISVRTCM